jgi:hypothetical protein
VLLCEVPIYSLSSFSENATVTGRPQPGSFHGTRSTNERALSTLASGGRGRHNCARQRLYSCRKASPVLMHAGREGVTYSQVNFLMPLTNTGRASCGHC